MKQYYYYLTSLPEVSIEMDRLPLAIEDFLISAEQELSVDDYEIVTALRYHVDNTNLVSLLNKSDRFLVGGVFSKEMLESQIKEPDALPSYMRDFLISVNEGTRSYLELSLENELTVLYYKWLSQFKSSFLEKYIDFDFELRNILTALNSRKYKMDIASHVLPHGTSAEFLIQNNLSDFGLTMHSYMPEVLAVFGDPDLHQRERKFDEMRGRLIDELLISEYFSSDKVFGYFLKLVLLSRWVLIEKGNGAQFFDKMTASLSDIDIFLKNNS